MRSLFGELREHISGKGVRIVFPEGNDDRVVRAAARLKFEELVDPIILGDPTEVHKILNDLGFVDFNCTIINPETYEGFEEMKEKFVEVRKGKATIEDADKLLRDVNYFGVMLVKLGLADEWFQARFTQQRIPFVLLFKLSKRNLVFLVHQVSSL